MSLRTSKNSKSTEKDTFLALVRLGIGKADATSLLPKHIDWDAIEALAEQHGLLGVIVDGVQMLPDFNRPPQLIWLRWIGKAMQNSSQYVAQQKISAKLAQFFHDNGIRTYVLKGVVVAECYPKPSCRLSADFDCFLLPSEGDFDACEQGNQLVESIGYEIKRNFYKNSTIHLPGLTVENHRFLSPFRGNDRLRQLEQYLQSELRSHKPLPSDFFHQTTLVRPPVVVSALFLIEHAYSHFLHEGLNWRYVLDWMMFGQKHKNEIDWSVFDSMIDEFGFRRFYVSFCSLGKYLFGEIRDSSLTFQDSKMMADVWADKKHKTDSGFIGKVNLASNTWNARWKYHYFSPISMPHALWIQVKGYLFDKNPKLN